MCNGLGGSVMLASAIAIGLSWPSIAPLLVTPGMTISRLEAVLGESKQWLCMFRPDPILPGLDFGVYAFERAGLVIITRRYAHPEREETVYTWQRPSRFWIWPRWTDHGR